VQKSDNATAPQSTSQAVPPNSAAGDSSPAAKVTISNKARAALRAAGASPNDIAKVDLADKNAVAPGDSKGENGAQQGVKRQFVIEQ
jgi:hypothetical protein